MTGQSFREPSKRHLIWSLLLLASGMGLVSGSEPSREQSGLAQLNAKLVEMLPNSDELTPNIAMARSLLKANNTSAGSSLRTALTKLITMADHSECNQDVLEAINYVSDGGANLRQPARRVDRLFKQLMDHLRRGCERFLEQEFASLESTRVDMKHFKSFYQQLSPNARTFLDPAGVSRFEQYLAEEGKSELYNLADEEVAKLGPAIADKSDPRNRFDYPDEQMEAAASQWDEPVSKNVANYKYVTKRYLIEPCKELMAIFGDLFKATYALKSTTETSQSLPNQLFMERRSKPFKDTLYRFKVCSSIINWNDDGLGLLYYQFASNSDDSRR